jgi:hypothetical protein
VIRWAAQQSGSTLPPNPCRKAARETAGATGCGCLLARGSGRLQADHDEAQPEQVKRAHGASSSTLTAHRLCGRRPLTSPAGSCADLIVDSSEQINPGPARRTRAVYLALIARGWAGLHQPRLGAWVRRRPADQVERSHCDEGTATVEQSALAASAWH